MSYYALSKQMELLQAKQSEQKKKLREQMEAEAKAQQDQMDNMMKASMKQAEEDSRAFMQEKKELNQPLVEMQKSNEGMQQIVESLSPPITSYHTIFECLVLSWFFKSFVWLSWCRAREQVWVRCIGLTDL